MGLVVAQGPGNLLLTPSRVMSAVWSAGDSEFAAMGKAEGGGSVILAYSSRDKGPTNGPPTIPRRLRVVVRS